MRIAHALQKSIETQWYAQPTWLWGLSPLVPLFSVLSKFRRKKLQATVKNLSVPVIVVGNITVGGTGKTPVVMALCKQLKSVGWRPAVISRGYGAELDSTQVAVVDPMDTSAQSARRFGDEPTLIAKRSGCPVLVSANRLAAAHYALEHFQCDVILSDDGLQHYRLPRQIEFAVVDAKRCLGNGYLLPLGPLREPPARLKDVDFIVLNNPGAGKKASPCEQSLAAVGTPILSMQLVPLHWRNLKTEESVPVDQLNINDAVAFAGIGNPQRFQHTLAELGFSGEFHAFPDHHPFQATDFGFASNKRVLMTAKDAVKCETFCAGNSAPLQDAWYLEVEADFAPQAQAHIQKTFEGLKQHVI